METENSPTKTYDLKKIQTIQLNILKELARVCDENNLKYYLACGTCIGAVRHKGFIPWDDDVDVYMHESDVKKLISLRDKFNDSFFVQCKETDANFESPIVRIRDSRTACFEKDEVGLDINHGFFVDVYPLYYYPKSKLAAYRNCMESYIYRILLAGRQPYNHGRMLSVMGKILLKLYRGEHRNRKIQAIESRLTKYKDTDELLTYYGLDIHFFKVIAYKKEWFQEPSRLLFEGEEFSGPTDPDKYLQKKYGDYMKLPPADKQIPHHSFVFADTEKSYTEYKGIYY